jgi:hypothetical protein
MSNALPVAKESIRNTRELAQDGQQGRGFPEREESGNIGKPQWAAGQVAFEHAPVMRVPQHDRADTRLSIAGESDVETRDDPDGLASVGSGDAS